MNIVNRMLAVVALALLSARHCAFASVISKHERVDPSTYDAFYLWPGIKPPEGSWPRTLYLLDGEIRPDGAARFVRLRPGTPHLPGTKLWLVVRLNRLDWSKAIDAVILADMRRWQEAGNRVVGLQVDFDAATRGIATYAHFLTGLRARLPHRWRLSVTGLMDWSANGDPHALAALRTVIDEVVVQTYQGHTTIPGYQSYFRQMAQFPIPFRVALVDGGEWLAPPILARQQMFRGYVVFLLHPRHLSDSGGFGTIPVRLNAPKTRA